ncbi:MAG: phospholipid carrier-dependent glycosyltransferase, partial [Chloroflexota bacterium]
MSTHWHKTDWLILASLILIATVFRVWRLDSVPPGFQFDEAYNASDALRIIAGERPLFFEANGGREALYVYWIAPFVATFGATAFALRLASAVIGIATVALSYVLWRRMLPPTERLVAVLAALLMATSYWHIHFSRYGIRAITLPLLLTATCYCLWDALPNVTSDKWHVTRKVFPVTCHSSLVTLVLCGFFLGLSIYAHPAARFVPIIITLWIAYSRFANRQSQSPNLSISNLQLPTSNFPSLISTFALIALTAFIIFVPLGYYFLNHPDQFIGHPKAVVS